MSNPETHPYQIRTVAMLTGLQEHNIRTWEKRYNLLEPKRTPSGRRLYSEADVQYLALLRQLVDRGHPIGSLVTMPRAELTDLLNRDGSNGAGSAASGEEAAASQRSQRTMVVGSQIQAMLEREAGRLPELSVVETFPNITAIEPSAAVPVVDILIVVQPNLFEHDIEGLVNLAARCQASRTLVVYQFTRQEAIAKLESVGGITAMQGPLNVQQLRLACLTDLPEPPQPQTDLPDYFPKRMFADSQLNQLWKVASTVKCECPQHLANLLLSLTAFEDYSATCENLNEKDAELHALLYRTTAEARVSFEQALVKILEAEGIEI